MITSGPVFELDPGACEVDPFCSRWREFDFYGPALNALSPWCIHGNSYGHMVVFERGGYAGRVSVDPSSVDQRDGMRPELRCLPICRSRVCQDASPSAILRLAWVRDAGKESQAKKTLFVKVPNKKQAAFACLEDSLAKGFEKIKQLSILSLMRVPKAIERLIESFEKLPGIGPKTAQRLTFYLLHVPQGELDSFSEAVAGLKKGTILCSICKNVGETDPCSVCSDAGRDKAVIMVVEQPLDVLALEKTRKYKGVYHVLHGAINPLENIGPDEIFIKELVKRVTSHPLRQSASEASESRVNEIILATNPTMEGEATAMYIRREISNIKYQISNLPKITRLGLGLPTGADLEYADETTLTQAIEGRREF